MNSFFFLLFTQTTLFLSFFLSTKIVTDYIPNVLLPADCVSDISNNHYTLSILNFDTSNLELDASNNLFPKLKLILDDNNTELTVTIRNIVSNTQIQIETDESIPSKVVVYGQEVDNVHVLIKDKIFTTGIAALQEIDRQQQADKAKIVTLEQTLALFEQRIAALENPST